MVVRCVMKPVEMNDVKCRVLVLKSQSEDKDEDPYVAALTEQKIPAVLVPILEFRFTNLDRLHARLDAPENYSGLIFASPRCVQSVIECFARGIDAEKREKWRLLECFVVGETTARLVDENLQLKFSGSSSGNMKALLQTIDPRSFAKPLLMPCGNLNKTLLEERNFNIEKVVVYETRPHSQLKSHLENEIPSSSLIVFFSPSGVEYAFPHIRNISHSKIRFIALGPTTSKAMEERSIEVSAVCEKPKPECLIREILKITRP